MTEPALQPTPPDTPNTGLISLPHSFLFQYFTILNLNVQYNIIVSFNSVVEYNTADDNTTTSSRLPLLAPLREVKSIKTFRTG